MLVALAVFVAVYALLAVPALPRLVRRLLDRAPSLRAKRVTDALLGRPGVSLLGAVALVALGAVAPRAALEAIDWRTLALLLGMMLLVAGLEGANVFGVLASLLARRLRTPARLLAGSMVVVAALSALVLNDAVVLLFTPVLVRAARAMAVSPFPFLAAEAFAANLGSAATPVGNPQNAAIALARDLSFVEFAVALAPVSLLSLALGVAFCLLAFRRDLAGGRAAEGLKAERVSNRGMLALALGGVGAALLGFVVGPAFGLPLWASALGAGVAVLALAPLARTSPLRVAASVDVGILAFFVGLFVLLEGVRGSDALAAVDALAHTGGSAGFVAATALLSNLVSNVPAVLLLLPGVTTDAQALLLAAASTFAGNLTFLGSAATVIVAETARAFGADFRVGRFTLLGLPLGALTLLLAWWALG